MRQVTVPDIGDSFVYLMPGERAYERRLRTRWHNAWLRVRKPSLARRLRDSHRAARTFRVSGYLKRYEPLPVTLEDAGVLGVAGLVLERAYAESKHGPDKCPLVFCSREEAEYVTGTGVCGVIVRVREVRVTGRVSWSEETLQSERDTARMLEGEVLF